MGTAAVFALAPLLLAQSQQPRWAETFQRIGVAQREGATLGANDAVVEEARAQIFAAGPRDPNFLQGLHSVANYYASEGYDRKALQLWLDAVAATAGSSLQVSARQALASQYERTGHLLQSTAILRSLLAELPANDAPTRLTTIRSLARTEEQMGELSAAETHFREADSLQVSVKTETPNGAMPPVAAGAMRMGVFVNRASFVGVPSAIVARGDFARASWPSQNYELAWFYQRHGKRDLAEAILRKSIEEGRQSNSPAQVEAATRALIQLLQSSGRLDEAIALSSQALAARENSPTPQPPGAQAIERQNLAQLLMQAGRAEEGIALLQRATETAKSSPDPMQYTASLNALGQAQINMGRLEDAEATVAKIRTIESQPNQDAKWVVQTADRMLAQIRERQNNHAEASELRTRSMNGSAAINVGPLWPKLSAAQQAFAAQDKAKGMALAQEALTAAAERASQQPHEVAALAQLAHQFPPEAKSAREQFLQSLMAILDGVTPSDHPRLADAYVQMLWPLMTPETKSEATKAADRAKRIIIASKGEGHPATHSILNFRVQVMIQAGDIDGAKAAWTRWAEQAEAIAGPRSQATVQALRETANLLSMAQRLPEEEQMRIEILRRPDPNFADMSRVHDFVALANNCQRQGKIELAKESFDQALAVAKQFPEMQGTIPDLTRQRDNAGNPPPAPARFGARSRWFVGQP